VRLTAYFVHAKLQTMTETPTQKLQRHTALSVEYRREAWAAGITSPYRLGRYVQDRLCGVSHARAMELQKGKREPV
jgi:hypothetical protein